MRRALRRAGLVWIALMVLLAITCASAFVPMGVWNGVVNMGVAAVKALLVALFFMHLADGPRVHRAVIVAALFTLALLLSLSQTDYAVRDRHAAPWESTASPR